MKRNMNLKLRLSCICHYFCWRSVVSQLLNEKVSCYALSTLATNIVAVPGDTTVPGDNLLPCPQIVAVDFLSPADAAEYLAGT